MNRFAEQVNVGIAALSVILVSLVLGVGIYVACKYVLFDFRSRFIAMVIVLFVELLMIGLFFARTGIL